MMAGTMVHLLIAEKLYENLSKKNWSYPWGNHYRLEKDYFIAGNICPDGIMMRKNYERQMKLHTHFRDDIPDGSFDIPENIQKFEQRMKTFWMENQIGEQNSPGLYLGYVTHMMTDERFILEERPKFFQAIQQIGLTIYDRETYVYFNAETDLVDFRLVREFPELQKAKQSLEQVSPYEIRDMITCEELTGSREWILKHFFYETHEEKETEFLSYESMVKFIETMVVEVTDRLFQEHYLVADKAAGKK